MMLSCELFPLPTLTQVQTHTTSHPTNKYPQINTKKSPTHTPSISDAQITSTVHTVTTNNGTPTIYTPSDTHTSTIRASTTDAIHLSSTINTPTINNTQLSIHTTTINNTSVINLPTIYTPTINHPQLSTTHTSIDPSMNQSTIHYTENVDAIRSLLYKTIAISNKSNEEVCSVTLQDILNFFCIGFKSANVPISPSGVCLIGSLASFIVVGGGITTAASTTESMTTRLAPTDSHKLNDDINDIDIVFHLQKPVHFGHILKVQQAVMSHLLRTLCDVVMSPPECYHQLFKESFHVYNKTDKWSLVSIGSKDTTIDIKVVYEATRQYAFSIDSFEVVLDTLLVSPHTSRVQQWHCDRVEVRSTFGDYPLALTHLREKKLYTRNPGEIRHGFFRYCLEITRGYTSSNILYDFVFAANFYQEFGDLEVSYFEMKLKKFVNKHKKHWILFLENMDTLLFGYLHPRSSDFVRIIDGLKKASF